MISEQDPGYAAVCDTSNGKCSVRLRVQMTNVEQISVGKRSLARKRGEDRLCRQEGADLRKISQVRVVSTKRRKKNDIKQEIDEARSIRRP